MGRRERRLDLPGFAIVSEDPGGAVAERLSVE